MRARSNAKMKLGSFLFSSETKKSFKDLAKIVSVVNYSVGLKHDVDASY